MPKTGLFPVPSFEWSCHLSCKHQEVYHIRIPRTVLWIVLLMPDDSHSSSVCFAFPQQQRFPSKESNRVLIGDLSVVLHCFHIVMRASGSSCLVVPGQLLEAAIRKSTDLLAMVQWSCLVGHLSTVLLAMVLLSRSPAH